ncbi:putative membrane protein YhhN [Tenacibaculum adriaticum]|uniref:Putative membrane protein YhhN n=1 Tax=Tenacibaculum adriaticum TaxID=413713 RepID=A0A5S5DUL4_9FLAO|nr:lysoplasmalogenase [Tenacibaculum adriaticum]TYP99384.1 putative membrane protein YhhN [Tenacibaculum adriaticum]
MTKQTKILIASILFLIVSAIEVYAVAVNSQPLEMIFKPLLMTVLAVVYLFSVKKPSFWFLSALFFSFWGDVFLLFKDDFFVFGLASFLFAHILYIKITTNFLKKESFAKVAVASAPFVVYLLALLLLINDNLGDMLIPVTVYGITISSFGAVTLLNYISHKSTANLWLFLGAVIFITSDSLIAINRFYEPKEIYGVIIMVTYIAAQYLICKAMVAKSEKS